MRDSWFYAVIGGFTFGIFFRSFVPLGVGFSAFVVMVGAVLFILPFLKGVPHSNEGRDLNNPRTPFDLQPPKATPFHKGDGDKSSASPEQILLRKTCAGEEDLGTSFSKGGIILALLIVSTGLGMLRFDFADRSAEKEALNPYLGQTIVFEGIVADEPDERETTTRLTIRFQARFLPAGGRSLTNPREMKVLVITNREPRFEYGDRLRIEGVIERPDNFKDEATLREVDYRSYLAKDDIYYEMFRPKIVLLSRGEGNPVVAKLFAFKRAFVDNIGRLIPEPHASLLAGLIVGAKQSLGKKLLDDFRTVGVIHIVVLSGYNITIIAYFIEWLFSRMRKNPRLILASVGIILFAIMVGASATVVRATIMALLVLLARSTGRIYMVTRALLIAGFFMLLHNPKILVFDVSFQLSFLATVGLIYFSPIIGPRVKWITEKWRMREIAVATVATQLFVLPFLLYKTGIMSLVSLPVNLLILAAIPFTMLFGFLAGVAGFAATALALPFAYAAYAFLAYELAIVEWFARLPQTAVAR